jgi:hypothetical protein
MTTEESLRKSWKKVPIPELSTDRRDWTETAINCLKINRACAVCPVNKIYGYTWSNGKCKIPIAVQTLIDNEVPFPANLKGGRWWNAGKPELKGA